MRIYKRKQESKQKRERVFLFSWSLSCRERVLFLFFLTVIAFSWSLSWCGRFFLFSFLLDRFLGRKRVIWFSYFLVFYYRFPPLWTYSAFLRTRVLVSGSPEWRSVTDRFIGRAQQNKNINWNLSIILLFELFQNKYFVYTFKGTPCV